jgi:hypothetical protein
VGNLGRDRLHEPSLLRLPAVEPHRDRILAAHAQALAEGAPGYLDPATGLYVMTAATHLARGTCCRNGCRHCPFVP